VHLEELAVVEHMGQHFVHVVRHVGGVRDELVELPVGVVDRELGLLAEHRRIFEVVAGQMGEQCLHVLDRVDLVGTEVVRIS
jgi:hypothetical protein